ncbi:hypothetical protein DXG03_008488 [Asterophora parasitica]|uniref:Uncharacterized protein n=1 Tax=Asterophora parasitica TaxID=117018 RepID=A0A9P7GED6_9AGAR|nr:hypothetical protein DXG03_008488 [Asterophora parasitica]
MSKTEGLWEPVVETVEAEIVDENDKEVALFMGTGNIDALGSRVSASNPATAGPQYTVNFLPKR